MVRLGLAVADTGIGIAPEAQARLFDAFVQADSCAARRFGGPGSAWRSAACCWRRMGGSIAVESAAGRRQPLPLRGAAAPRRRPPPRRWPPAEARPLRVLVAEDIAANRLLITHTCGGSAMRWRRWRTARSGRGGAFAPRRTAAFDLVLMDVMMPVMDGLAATRAIRALPAPAAGSR